MVPGGVQGYDRYAYANNNPICNSDATGHWPGLPDFGFSLSTTWIGDTYDRIGNAIGMKNLSSGVASVLSGAATVLDGAAEATDLMATAVVAASVVVGATAGAATTSPGGPTTIVGGAAGALAGYAYGELGVRGLIASGNILATGATVLNAEADLVSDRTQYSIGMNGGANGINCSSSLTIGGATLLGGYTTLVGWEAPLAPLSLLTQSAAVAGDTGLFSPPSLHVDTKMSASFKEKKFDYGINIAIAE